MRLRRPPLTCLMFFGCLLVGCPTRSTLDGEDPDPPPRGTDRPGTLTITPNPIDVTVSGTEQVVPLHVRSSTDGDVTRRVTWSITDPSLGGVQNGRLVIRAGLDRGGRATLYATYGIQSGSAEVRVKLVAPDLVDASAPVDVRTYFDNGEGAAKPAWVYPLQGTMLPRNHPQMTLQWTGTADGAAYRITIDSPTYAQNIYVGRGACQADQCQYAIPDDKWVNIARSAAGGEARLVLSASPGAGQRSGTADPLVLSFSPEDVRGGLYYWSTTITGIYRVPIGAKQAQVFINRGNEFGCAGCHAVSRDGKRVALEFGSANGTGGGVVDGTDGTKYIIKPPAAGQWNLQTFSPNGDLLLVNWRQQGRVIQVETGRKLFDFPERMAQPEWSPDGQYIVYVRYPPGGSGDEWMASNTGDIVIIPWNGGAWGAPQVLVQSKPGQEYHFYPSWTPDSKWIIFNTGKVPCGGFGGAGCNTYDPSNTILRLVRAQPGHQPIDLQRATHKTGGSTNWPRVAPFVQDNGRLIFFTFSAKYPYGFLKRGNNPQIWMAAVDLGKAEAQPDQDPSYAPFWLTFQKIDENNHLGTWTQDVACVTDDQCPGEFHCVGGQCVPRTPG
ncbi:MAG: hypothetical protein RMK29_03805 [Myxococcales bacterium]|nr:hypothetical protein [Myxococcota bacterium]MDW8280812.1 hypothetical protein [Myxococcales bacterium]